MQRYHATSCTSAVNNSAIGGVSARDRVDPSSLPANFSINQRRQPQLAAYKLRCDKEPLNSRLGPPDFNPQTPNCPEETLNREYAISGYKETVEGLEEARELLFSQVPTFSKPVILKCKEAIRKCHRAINDSRAQKRKAGQVYGVPLSGQLLTKPGLFPEQRPCGEELRRKWIEGLSQPHKRLRSLADHVPHGYRKKTLFEALIKNNVPLLRATWFIKVTYLNQIRPFSAGTSSGVPDKTQVSRTEQWTKDVIEYLQSLLDEVVSRHGFHSNSHSRDRLPQMTYNSLQHKNDPMLLLDGEEPSLHFKWWYLVRIIQWHHTEGLLHPSPIIEWVLSQLQEKDLLGTLQLLLPILYSIMETVVLSQTYVRAVVGLAVRFIQEPSPGGSDLVDNSRRAYTTSALVEMIRYMIHAVPDTFVSLDCFPLPSCVMSYVVNDGNFLSKVGPAKTNTSSEEVGYLLKNKGPEAFCQSLAVNRVVSSIRQRTNNLAVATRPGYRSRNVAKTLQELDRALVHGDSRTAYTFIFEDLCNGDIDDGWMGGVSPCLRSSLKWIGTMRFPFIGSVFLLFEWATCDFRDLRTAAPQGMKFTGRKDFSQVYLAVRILKLKIEDLRRTRKSKNGRGPRQLINAYSSSFRRKENPNPFESPGPLHDIIACWIDQHEVHNGEGFKRLQLLIIELIRSRIFCPQAYVRQLIVSGTMDSSGPTVDMNRKRRHYKVLKHLPGPHVCDLLKDAQGTEFPLLSEAMDVYSNERRFLLHRLSKLRHSKGSNSSSADAYSLHKTGKSFKSGELEELKDAISVMLQFSSSSTATSDATGDKESQGSIKKIVGLTSNKIDLGEGTPGCEECKKEKRSKLGEERNSYVQDYSQHPSEEEDSWWMRKGMKPMDVLKIEPPVVKPVKQSSRGRQKVVRKTQSLAQLATARIEGSQGASTSHVCDNRVSCPHHKTGLEGELPKLIEGSRTLRSGDIVSIGKKIKQLRFVEKRIVAAWLINTAKQFIEESEKGVVKVGQYSRTLPSVDDKSSLQWKLGEDELSAIVYLGDISDDLVSVATFLLWLLPKVLSSSSPTILSGRNFPNMPPKNVGSRMCEVGEGFLVSSIRRYENILVANDLLPEVLSAMMHRVVTLMTSNARFSGSAALVYSRYLLKKYSGVPSVVEWEKNFKATCDKRLISELQSGKSLDGEVGFPLGVPAGVEDLDDFLRQKISGVRVSRVGISMREAVQRKVEETFQYFCGKERKAFPPNNMKISSIEKGDDGYQFAHQMVVNIMDCMRQTGGAAQEGDPSLVSSAVSAIVGSISQVLAKLPDLTATGNHSNVSPSMGSFTLAQRMLRFHVTCLSLLKEALGDRQNRVFEIALAVESSLILSQALIPGKTNEMKVVSGRVVKPSAAVSALVVAAILHGVASLDRMVTVFRLKEGLDVIQFARNSRSNSNGNARSGGILKADNLVEVSVHWFRVLIGNCRTVCDGLILELLGEASVVALSRMQRALPLSLVFPPAYSIFAFMIWRPFLFNPNLSNREAIHQLNQSFALAMGEVIKHLPFRDVCLKDTHGFYDLVAADPTDFEFASMLEMNGAEMNLKKMAFVPVRARLFLNAIIDCKIQPSFSAQDDAKRVLAENESKLLDRLVHILDTLQPAKFHWQWVELRLLLNEQALIEKLESHDISIAESIRAVSTNPDKAAASENENNFIEIILTRLLVRPDAASLFSEVIHLFGKSLEDSMLLQVKWFLKGSDVLFGRKSIRQRLINIAESKGLSTKPQFRKRWGWCSPDPTKSVATKGNKRKFESISLEEGEVVEEGTGLKKSLRGPNQGLDDASQQYVTEKALIELVLSCLDQSSDESRNIFANDLIKQMSDIEQQISSVTRGAGKQVGAVNSGTEVTASKSRKATRGGSPGLSRRQTITADIVPPTPAALRASMALRLQFLFRLLPIIWADGEPSVRNMRHMLASVILRLLGSRVVHEDADIFLFTASNSSIKRDMDFSTEILSGGSLFDRLLLMLHGLLSSYRPSWLKSKKEFSSFDRDVAETLQKDLDRMQLPDTVRWRIQAAMPILFPSFRRSVSLQPPSLSPSALPPLLSIISPPGNSNLPLRNQALTGKNKPLPHQQQDTDVDIDPWMLLEDGAASGQSLTSSAAVSGGDNGNFKASSWLKGAVRMRRMDLTYIGATDDDS